MDQIDYLILQSEQLRKKNWLKSVEILHNALSKNSENVKLLTSLGNTYSFKNKHRKAQECYRQVLNQQVNVDEILLKLADSHIACSEDEIATKYLSRVSKQSLDLLYKKAIIAVRLQHDIKAEKLLDKIIESYPDFISAYFLKIELLLKNRRMDETFLVINLIKGKFGETSQINFLEGVTYFQQKNWISAFSNFKKAEKQKFKFSIHIKLYGIACYKIGLYALAEKKFMNALRLLPFDASLYEYLIKIYIKTNRIEKAKSFISGVSKTIPITKNLARLYASVKYGKNSSIKS